MGYPITAELGKITSWGSAEDVTTLLANTRVVNFGVTFKSDEQDITAMAATSMEYMGGLRSAEGTFEALWPNSAPVLGDTAAITFAGGYAQFAQRFRIAIDFGEEDITPLPTATGGWRRFMPSGLIKWSGSYTALAVSDTAASLPTAVNTAAGAATFKLKECGATDATWGGNIMTTSLGHRQSASRGKVELDYAFMGSGALTITAGSSGGPAILPAGAVDKSDWDTNGDGVPDVTWLGQTFTSRTISGAAFLRSLELEATPGQPIKVTGSFRFSDAVTLA